MSASQSAVREQVQQATLPIEYETAVKALTACVSIDEAKYWSDKASALAAWAKIYHSKSIDRKAKVLKLHAYRRMAELARDIQRTKSWGEKRIRTILERQGLSVTEARQIDGVGRASKEAFERALNMPHPPSPWAFTRKRDANELIYLRSFHTLTKRISPHEFARLIDRKAAAALHEIILDMSEWLDELDQLLPKADLNGRPS
jgi:hypothetical protein